MGGWIAETRECMSRPNLSLGHNFKGLAAENKCWKGLPLANRVGVERDSRPV